MSAVDHPVHYCAHPSGIEAIVVCENLSYCIGNAVKYLWRAGVKTADPVEDLQKAAWYVRREIKSGGGRTAGVDPADPLFISKVCGSFTYHIGSALREIWSGSYSPSQERVTAFSRALEHVEREVERNRQNAAATPPGPPPHPTEVLALLYELRERCAEEADYEVQSARIGRRAFQSAEYAAKHIHELDVDAWLAAGRPHRDVLKEK